MTLPVNQKVVLVSVAHGEDAEREANVLVGISQAYPEAFDSQSNVHPLNNVKFVILPQRSFQDSKTSGHNADILMYVFKHRVEESIWDDLINSRQRAGTKPIFIFFSDSPPPDDQMTSTLAVSAWLDTLERRKQLLNNHSAQTSTLIIGYRSPEVLQDIARVQIQSAALEIVTNDTFSTSSTGDSSSAPRPPTIKSFLEQPAGQAEYDERIVRAFRRQLTPHNRVQFPRSESHDTFLEKLGVRHQGQLTHAGVLLFTSSPHRIMPNAFVRCAVYEGLDKMDLHFEEEIFGPVQKQIERIVSWISIYSHLNERPFAIRNSASGASNFAWYPSECIHEIVANAICHRDYSIESFVEIEVFSDRIEVRNPGMWEDIAIAGVGNHSIGNFSESLQSINPRLRTVLSTIGMVAGKRQGIANAVNSCRLNDAHEPVVRSITSDTVVTIFPNKNLSRSKEESAPREDNEVFLERSTIEVLCDFFIRVSHESHTATLMVKRAGFPVGHLPAFKTAGEFWSRVIEDAAKGRVSISALLDEALKQFPLNPEIHGLRDRVLGQSTGLTERPESKEHDQQKRWAEKEAVDLLTKWRQGDGISGNLLITRQFPRIRRFFAHKVADRDVVKHLTEITLRAIHEDVQAMRSRRSFSSFLFLIATDILFDYLCEMHKQTESNLRKTPLARITPASTPNVGHQKVLTRAFRELPLEKQILVELYLVEKMDALEVAEALTISSFSVWRQIEIIEQELPSLLLRFASSELLESTQATIDAWSQRIKENKWRD